MRDISLQRAALAVALAAPALAFGAAQSVITVVGDGGVDVGESVVTDTATWYYAPWTSIQARPSRAASTTR